MKRKVLRFNSFKSLSIAALVLTLALVAWAAVPAPPVNQIIGMPDVLVGDQQEAFCRGCHASGVANRHHLLVGEPIPLDSIVPNPDADGDGKPDTAYGCFNCHEWDSAGNVLIVHDCTVCHKKSPHHATGYAQNRHCKACHGSLVDDYDDGHYIPTYAPSLITPRTGDGGASPVNSRGIGAGGCKYCHDDDALAPPLIRTNEELHHGTGLDTPDKCGWCHDFSLAVGQIRVCESCHGPASLHSIQADSPRVPTGTIVVGGEDAGYGHVGRDNGPGDSDCWGCHAFGLCGNGILDPGEQCDDGNTRDGDCCSAHCTFEAAGSACTDAKFCNGNEVCDGAGTCLPGLPVDCSDGIACTNDVCDETTRACVHTPDNSKCPDDGLFCNGQEVCTAAAGCVSTGNPCASGTSCYEPTDQCIPTTGTVTICHIPPGNPGKKKTMSIAAGSVPDHLAHGDQLGPC